MMRRVPVFLSYSLLLAALVAVNFGCGSAAKTATDQTTSGASTSSSAAVDTTVGTAPATSATEPASSTTTTMTANTGDTTSTTGSASTTQASTTVTSAGDPIAEVYTYELQKWTETLSGPEIDFKDPAHPTNEELAAADKLTQQLDEMLRDLRMMWPPSELKDLHNELITAFEKVVSATKDYVQAVKTGDAAALASSEGGLKSASAELLQALTAVSTAATSTTTLPPGDPQFKEKMQAWASGFSSVDLSAVSFKDAAHPTNDELASAGKYADQVQPLLKELSAMKPPPELRATFSEFAGCLSEVVSRTKQYTGMDKDKVSESMLASFARLVASAFTRLQQAAANDLPKLVSP